ncbi:hypothetical protein M413DRAFT_447277 [Hebeloma cylindrosporum]|uniref:Uncharacterized protein n=1 Tax=Hebeloma cylindrosporum TaxID=76867 RepID=A0A0C3BRM2_HEBCY|nr:hypothetical protein M413DRAFT_447277 [Hebeloma cylindrosporum h7]
MHRVREQRGNLTATAFTCAGLSLAPRKRRKAVNAGCEDTSFSAHIDDGRDVK